ncbi:MAG: HDIG domain-containing protein [Trueperaceae bacterium]
MSSTARRRSRPAKLPFWLLALAAVASLAVLLFSVYGTRQREPLRIGQPSPQTFVAPADTQVIDWIATQRERQAARAQIETMYTSDPELKSLVSAAVTSSGLPAPVVDEVLRRYQQPSGVRAEDVETLIDEVALLAPSDRQREARLVLERRLVATSVPNDRLTQAARDAAAAAVPAVMQSLEAGQIIVAAGDPLTEDVLRVLDSLGLYSARAAAVSQTAWIVVGVTLLALLLAAPLVLMREKLLTRITLSQLTFMVTLSVIVLVVQRVAVLASPNFLFALLVPLVASALLGEGAGLLWGAWLALALGLLVPASPLFVVAVTLVGSATAVLLVQTIRSRLALLLAGTGGGLLAGLMLLVMVLVGGGMTISSALSGAALVFAGGVLAGVLALGLLPIAESMFGFLTDFRLIELSSPTSPLLQRLIAEAPGTYQHSLIISNLVDQAVTNVGGNALLARVGALYHDVGKMRRPHFFVENQFTGDNPHDRISPHLSYLIITSHVRDGIEMLREARLPRDLEAFVAEHHGTTVLSYFYKRALDEGQVEELNFRYPGPKPRTKETAILMLADAVESASRTLVDATPSSIRALIDRLIEERLQDGQLSDSPLNFHDVEVIANTFERMLTAILHRRVSYPSADDLRGARRDRGSPSEAAKRSAGPAARGAERPAHASTDLEERADGVRRGTGRDAPVRSGS